jgi:hypothetical protein
VRVVKLDRQLVRAAALRLPFLLTLATTPSCSFAMARVPDKHPGMTTEECSASPAIADVAFVAAVIALGVFTYPTDCGDLNDNPSEGCLGSQSAWNLAIPLAALPYVVSAVYGFNVSSKCERVVEEAAEEPERERAAAVDAHVAAQREQCQKNQIAAFTASASSADLNVRREHLRRMGLCGADPEQDKRWHEIRFVADDLAASGDCKPAVRLEETLRGSPEHDVFVKDVLVAPCLAAERQRASAEQAAELARRKEAQAQHARDREDCLRLREEALRQVRAEADPARRKDLAGQLPVCDVPTAP